MMNGTKEATMDRKLTEDERALLTHTSMFGSDGYPINKLKRGWTWGPFRSVNGPPSVFKTKREAVASFERFLDILIEASGQEAKERFLGERAAARFLGENDGRAAAWPECAICELPVAPGNEPCNGNETRRHWRAVKVR
jgi:hypothetical protein